MDKAEYRIKLEQINSLAEAGDFKGAAAVVDTIDWRHVKSVRTLCMVGEIYEANKRYEDSKRVLEYAYKRSLNSKTVLYRLAEINIRTGDYDDAKRYYNEFEQLSPHDTSRYILKYKLLRAEGASLDDQIAVLKEYKEREYTERWAYELAKLYMKNGQKQKCIEECDEMILWFAEGKYVTRAMELKMKLRALSDSQKKKYNDRYNAEKKELAEEAIQEESMTAEERISRAADIAADEEENVPAEPVKERKLTAAEIIRKMDAAADETVSSAMGDERALPKAAAESKAVEAFEREIKATEMTAEELAAQTAEDEAVAEEMARVEAAMEEAVKAMEAEAAKELAKAEEADEIVEEVTEPMAEEVAEIAEEKAAVEEAAEPIEEVVKAVEEAAAAEASETIEKDAETEETDVEEAAAEEATVEDVTRPVEEAAETVEPIAGESAAVTVELIAAEMAAEAAAEETAEEESARPVEEVVDPVEEAVADEVPEPIELVVKAVEEAAANEEIEAAAADEAVEVAEAVEAVADETVEAAAPDEVIEAAEAVEETAADEAVEAAEAVEETATEESAPEIDAAAALVRASAEQANAEAAEEAAWKAAAVNTDSADYWRKAIDATRGAALAEAEEEAAWRAAVSKETDGAGKEAFGVTDESDITDETASEKTVEAYEGSSDDEEDAEDTMADTENETAESADADTEDETARSADADTEDETAESAEADTEDDAAESADAGTDVEAEKKSAPVSPEEIAKNADEEAERALQEMMASFLSEFASSGSEYKMTTDIIPDEDDTRENTPDRESKVAADDREQMLGKETDESLGLTRTESFQELLKKALEEGGNYEEASQIVISDELESPEDAAKRTVMTAHGLDYEASEEYEDESGNEDAAEGTDESSDEEVSEETETAYGADSSEEAFEDGEVPSDGAGLADVSDTDEEDKLTAEGDSDDGTADESGESFANDAEDDSQEPSDDEDRQEVEGDSEAEGEAEESGEEEAEPVREVPKVLELVEVVPRKFTEEEAELFSYFAEIPGMSEQATLALADIHNNAGDKTSKSGNVLIMGRQLSGKTRFADALICAACMDLGIKAAKVAKVIGEDLNDKDAAEIVDRMAGGFLLIEGAGSLSDEFVEKLNTAMEFRTDGLVVILEDEKADLKDLLDKHEEFARKFTSKVIIPVFTNDELVTFARTYANEQGYKLDEMGTLALYTMIGENQKDTEPVVVGKVKKMIDRAIEKSKGPKIASLFRKKSATEDGRNWLREKDFRN